MLVWQDFVNATIRTPAGQQAWRTEFGRTMSQLHTFPSIIGWVVFNEGWGEWDREETGRIAEQVKAADPSRIVNAHSGVNCCDSKGDSGKGDVFDHHDYLNETPPYPDATRMAMDGEHGGFTLRTPGHMWPGPPANIYSGVADKAALTAKYVDNTETFYLAAAGAELSASVYTQFTDLENELNGLWTYDRRRIKVEPGPVRTINRRVIQAGAEAGEDATFPGRGEWRLDEGAGATPRDSSGGGSHLTLTGDTTWVPGVAGQALSFDGDGDYAGGNRARHPITPELNRWYHLAGVRDHATGQVRLYVDGQPAGAAAAGPDVVSTGPLAIGRAKYAGSRTDFWSGAVDQVHAYDRALTDAEVAALHAAQKR